MTFAVVKFNLTNEIATVPTCWIIGNYCLWPPKSQHAEIIPLIQKGISASNVWDRCSIKILGIYATYKEARQKLIISEDTLNINLTNAEDCGQGKRVKRRISPSSSEPDADDDPNTITLSDLPDIPTPVKQPRKNREHPYIVRCSGNVQDVEIKVESDVICTTPQDSEDFSESLGLNQSLLTSSSVNFSRELDSVDITGHSTNHILQTSPSTSFAKHSESVEHPRDYILLTNPCTSFVKQSDFEKIVLKDLSIIKAQQKILLKSIDSINKMIMSRADIMDVYEDPLLNEIKKVLPIANESDLDFVEKMLDEEDVTNKMELFLSKIGGNSLDHAIKFMLKRIISDELASTYSYLGARSKKAFKDLKICNLIKDSVKRTVWKNATEVSIQNVVMNWLRHAKGRAANKNNKV